MLKNRTVKVSTTKNMARIKYKKRVTFNLSRVNTDSLSVAIIGILIKTVDTILNNNSQIQPSKANMPSKFHALA